MKRLTILFLTIFHTATYGQKQANIWYFGDHAGLDFNNNPPAPLLNGQTYFPACCGWNEGTSSISDSSGSLLFYSNGEKIWNKFQQVMPNGNNLMGHASSAAASMVVPQPGSQQYFYVFTTDGSENNFQNGLRYSIVDMCLDNNKGDVLAGAKNILLVDSVAEKLVCIKHSNGNDYWMVTHKFNSDAFYALRLTSTGMSDTVISIAGPPDVIGWGGQMIASPNGEKICYAIPSIQNTGQNFLVDFDNATGIVSNAQILSTGGRVYGVSFSPDNSKLYCSATGTGELYQYDLNAGNLAAIIASKTFIVQNGPDGWRQHQLGPDGKIYISRAGKQYISIIEFPDSLCPACNYIDSAIYLGGQYTSAGLSHFITGFNYSNNNVQCNTGIEQNGNSGQNIIIYPNPASQTITIELPVSEIYTVIIRDFTGRKIYASENVNGTIITDCSQYSEGIYFIEIICDNNTVAGKFIKK